MDGVDELYMNYMDVLITLLKSKYGDQIWWTSFDEIAQHMAEGMAQS